MKLWMLIIDLGEEEWILRSYLFLFFGFFLKTRNSSETVSLVLFLDILLLRILRPPGVRLRARYPSLRSLLSFLGWYVLLGTILYKF